MSLEALRVLCCPGYLPVPQHSRLMVELTRLGAQLAQAAIADQVAVLLGEPERYVNHSCANNTGVEEFTDVAVRDILPGEEITSDYRSGGAVVDLYAVAVLQTSCPFSRAS